VKLLFGTFTGSRAFNLHLATSDVDLVGVYLAPTLSFLGMSEGQYPKQFHLSSASSTRKHSAGDLDLTLFEVGEVLEQLLRGNPHSIEILFCDNTKNCFSTPEWKKIANFRDDFISKEMLKNYLASVAGMWKTIEKKMNDHKKPGRIYYVIKLFKDFEKNGSRK